MNYLRGRCKNGIGPFNKLSLVHSQVVAINTNTRRNHSVTILHLDH